MPRLRSLVGVVSALALVAMSYGEARADAHEEDGSVATEASAKMTLPAGSLLIQLPVEVNLSKDLVAKPLSIAPDIWYGVADKLTVGIVHSSLAGGGFFIGGSGSGVCVTGEDNGCGEVYDNVGLDLRFSLLEGGFLLAAEAGAFVEAFDPLTLSAKVGLAGMLAAGPLNIIFSPNIFIGITERDGTTVGEVVVGGNKEVISVPVTFAVGLGSAVSFGVQTGLSATLEDLADNIVVPLSAGLRFNVSPKLGFDAAFSFPLFFNKAIDDGTNFDARGVTVAASIAL